MPSFAQFGNELYTGQRSFDFVGRRWLWYGIALAAVLLSALALGVRGLELGIDFRGGSEFRVTGVADTSDLIGERAVTEVVPGAQPRVSAVGSNGVRVQTSKLTSAQNDEVSRALAKAYDVPDGNVSASFVGPTWGNDVRDKALRGLIVFLILVGLVIAAYFRNWKMAVAALVALLHDLILTVGVYALIGFEVTPATVIGFLTILGYSLYDTVVVFDKVRENTDHIAGTTKHTYAEAANLAVNQTLVRSINTSVVALLPVGSILFIGAFLLGAGTLKDLALALFVGIAAGTYSSVFIATPLLVNLRQHEPALKAQAERVARKRAQPEKPAKVAVAAGASGEQATANGGGAARSKPKAAGAAKSGQRSQPRKAGGKRPAGKRR